MFGDEDQPYSSYMKLQWPAAATAQWGHEILQFFFAPKTWRSTKDVKWERNMTQKYDTNYNEMGIYYLKQFETCSWLLICTERANYV